MSMAKRKFDFLKTKAVSNRDCVGKKRQVHRKNLIIVSGCYIPLSGETDCRMCSCCCCQRKRCFPPHLIFPL